MASSEVATAAEVKPEPALTPAVRLPVSEPKSEDHYRRRWFIKAPEGTTREDAMSPAYWVNIGRWLNRHDVVFLLAPDESWELELRIESVRQRGCDVSIVKNYSRTAINLAETWIGEDHFTQYQADSGWCVIRARDRFPVIKGHTLEVSAINQFHREQPRAVA